MPTFSNLKDLKKFAQGKVKDTVKKPKVLSAFRHAMVDAVYTEVYDAYDSEYYDNRYEDGGLSDARNMVFTEHKLVGDTFTSNFENLTVGSDARFNDHPTDSMSGYFISELIENGSDFQHTSPSNATNGWYKPDGAWADPRPFAKATAEKLNKTTHNKILKHALEHGINN